MKHSVIRLDDDEADSLRPEIVVVSTIVEEKDDDTFGDTIEFTSSRVEDSTPGAMEASGPLLGAHTTLPDKEARILGMWCMWCMWCIVVYINMAKFSK